MNEVTIPIRWRDMDAYGHVNNAVYLNYLEECRDRLVEDLFGTAEAWDFVLAHVGDRLPEPAHAGRRRDHGPMRGRRVRHARACARASAS